MGMIATMLRAMDRSGSTMSAMIAAVEEIEDAAPARKSRGGSSGRGARLADGWVLTVRLAKMAMEMGLSEAEVRVEAETFKDYWTAKAGAGSTKLDWDATWRNWCRKAAANSRRRMPRKDGKTVPNAVPIEASHDDWTKRMIVWRKMGCDQRGWHPTWGPMPGEPGCMVPRDLLVQSAV